jgi:small subunit ribosomal protein S18
MARNSKPTKKKSPDRRPRPTAAGGGRPRRGRPKVCLFCREHATWVDYKDVNLLKRFVNDRGRIRARGATGTCAQHQRDVATAIKTARELALLPYVVRSTATESRGDRRGRSSSPAPDRGADPSVPDSETIDQAEDMDAEDEGDGAVVEGPSDLTLPTLTDQPNEATGGGRPPTDGDPSSSL